MLAVFNAPNEAEDPRLDVAQCSAVVVLERAKGVDLWLCDISLSWLFASGHVTTCPSVKPEPFLKNCDKSARPTTPDFGSDPSALFYPCQNPKLQDGRYLITVVSGHMRSRSTPVPALMRRRTVMVMVMMDDVWHAHDQV